jgi:hypothetical protein
VTVGRRRDAEVEVSQGLTAGDLVAVQGAGFLNDGDVVHLSNPLPILLNSRLSGPRHTT